MLCGIQSGNVLENRDLPCGSGVRVGFAMEDKARTGEAPFTGPVGFFLKPD